MKILLRVLDHIAGIRILGRARPAAAFFLLVGIPGYGVFTAILLAYRASITAKIPELATYYLALTWGWMGMAIIWYYYFPLLASFKKSIVTIMVKVPENLETVTTGGTLANTLVLMWALLVAYAFLSAFSYIQSKIGVVPGSAGYYVALAGVFLFGCVTGVGGLFVLNTMLLVRRICRQREFVIDVYNVDNMGGLSAVGKLTLISTLLCSSGAVCIPALVTVAKTIGSMHSMALYLLALLASIGILVSFLYPNFMTFLKFSNL